MGYSAYETAEATGVPYRTLMWWVEEGVIRPYRCPRRGEVQAAFSNEDIQEIKIISRLREFIPLQKLREIRRCLKGTSRNPFCGGEFLVVSGDVVKVCSKIEAINTLESNTRLRFVVNLKAIT